MCFGQVDYVFEVFFVLGDIVGVWCQVDVMEVLVWYVKFGEEFECGVYFCFGGGYW